MIADYVDDMREIQSRSNEVSNPYSFSFCSNYQSADYRNELLPVKWGKRECGGWLRWWSAN